MTIPPINNSNNTLKLFKAEPSSGGKNDKAEERAPRTSEDVVEISEAAQQRLDNIKALRGDNPAEIRQAASETRDILEENPDITLGRKAES